MLAARRPSARLSVSVAPPPPPVIKTALPAVVTRDAFDSLPDSAVTLPLLRPAPAAVPVPVPAPATPVLEVPHSSTRPARHARSFELSAVATLSVAATLVATLFASRVLHSGGSRVALGEAARVPSTTTEPVRPAATAQRAVSELGPSSAIPVVPLADLPLEHGGSTLQLASSSPSRALPSGSVDRAELARVLGRAAHAASGCGPGPVDTQILVTFAPSGAPRFIHFAASPPPAAMQSCVLSAVARSRIPAFEGRAISVSKTIRW
jgi:hypothetical protein